MTMQRAELLFHNGAWLSLHSLPLEPYFEQIGTRPNFSRFLSSVGRGYVGCWALMEGKLFLTEIQQLGFEKLPNGSMSPGMIADPLLLSVIFPEQETPKFADWYTGKLRCPMGEVIATGRWEFGDLYERYLEFSVERGEILKEEVVESVEHVSAKAAEYTASMQQDHTTMFRKWLNRFIK